jgi:hypothetical protein
VLKRLQLGDDFDELLIGEFSHPPPFGTRKSLFPRFTNQFIMLSTPVQFFVPYLVAD